MRSFADDDGPDPSRVGGKLNPFMSNSGMDTIICGRNGNQDAATIYKWSNRKTYVYSDCIMI